MVPWYHDKMVADWGAEKKGSRFWGELCQSRAQMLQGRLWLMCGVRT
mgnify:CR=1 FL=1